MANNIKSNELLSQDIQYIKDDIAEIKRKLDTKYVSHETYQHDMKNIRDMITWIIRAAVFILAPVYGAMITLIVKVFAG